MASILDNFDGDEVRITVRTSPTETVQIWGKVTGATFVEADTLTGGRITSLEVTEAHAFDVVAQRWIGPPITH